MHTHVRTLKDPGPPPLVGSERRKDSPLPSGSRWSLAGQAVSACAQFTQLVLLARLLTSSDFGIGALFLLLVGIGQIIWDLGTSAAVIQRQDIRQRQLASLHALNILLAAAYSALIWCMAPALERLFEMAGSASFFRWAGAAILLSAIGGQFRALHLKKMNFRTVASIDAVAAITACSGSVLAALQGQGASSFAFGVVCGAIANTALLMVSGFRFRTRWPDWKLSGVSTFLKFGFFYSGSSSINFIQMNLDVAILAGLLGTTELGKYALAKQLGVRPLEILQPILIRSLLPQIAKLQGDPSARGEHFLRIFRAVNALYLPFMIALICGGPWLIPPILGSQWHDAIPVFQVLAAAHLMRFLTVPSSISLMATGRVSQGFAWDVAVSLTLVIAVLFARPRTATSMATILFCVYLLALIPHWYAIVRPNLQLGIWHWSNPFVTPLLASIASVVIAWLLSGALAYLPLKLAVFAVGGFGAYLLLTIWLNRPAIRALGLLPSIASRRQQMHTAYKP